MRFSQFLESKKKRRGKRGGLKLTLDAGGEPVRVAATEGVKKFSDFCAMMEAGGMGTVSCKCMGCDQSQRVSKYTWNSGRAKCKYCGGGLEEV